MNKKMSLCNDCSRIMFCNHSANYVTYCEKYSKGKIKKATVDDEKILNF
mgnify:CR=1 FL=1